MVFTTIGGPGDIKEDPPQDSPPQSQPRGGGGGGGVDPAAGRSVNVVGGVTSMMLGASTSFGMLAGVTTTTGAHIDPALTTPLVILGGVVGFVCWLLPTFKKQ